MLNVFRNSENNGRTGAYHREEILVARRLWKRLALTARPDAQRRRRRTKHAPHIILFEKLGKRARSETELHFIQKIV